MPPRNLLIIALTIVVALACYSMAAKNRYANLFAEALEVIDRQSLREVPRQELFRSAMNGMMDQFDDHSMYISDEMFQAFDEEMRQEFGGVGMYVEVDPDTNQLAVLAPMPNTPAWEAGLQVGDQIVTVDGQPTKDRQRRDTLKMLRGPVGKKVVLEIARDGQMMTKELVRRIIPVDSLHGDSLQMNGSWEFQLEDYPRIGYLRLTQFGEKSALEIRKALSELEGKMDGIILDLRSNSGGLLDVAVEICDMMLPADLAIVRTLGRNKKVVDEYFSTSMMALDPSIPMCVLIDRSSASASEIVAGCLQDHGRATVIGEQSWGKGTVQNVIPLQRGQSAIKITTASYWRPSGKNIDREDEESQKTKIWGVQPSSGFEVDLTENEAIDNIRFIGIRELKSLVTPDQLEYIRKLRTQNFSAMPTENSPQEDDENNSVASEPTSIGNDDHRDLPLEKAINHIRQIVER
ncbi:MAG: S41 family peptidase, partial [Planctomycetota bacterium]